jgi:hypothetical protein
MRETLSEWDRWGGTGYFYGDWKRQVGMSPP